MSRVVRDGDEGAGRRDIDVVGGEREGHLRQDGLRLHVEHDHLRRGTRLEGIDVTTHRVGDELGDRARQSERPGRADGHRRASAALIDAAIAIVIGVVPTDLLPGADVRAAAGGPRAPFAGRAAGPALRTRHARANIAAAALRGAGPHRALALPIARGPSPPRAAGAGLLPRPAVPARLSVNITLAALRAAARARRTCAAGRAGAAGRVCAARARRADAAARARALVPARTCAWPAAPWNGRTLAERAKRGVLAARRELNGACAARTPDLVARAAWRDGGRGVAPTGGDEENKER